MVNVYDAPIYDSYKLRCTQPAVQVVIHATVHYLACNGNTAPAEGYKRRVREDKPCREYLSTTIAK